MSRRKIWAEEVGGDKRSRSRSSNTIPNLLVNSLEREGWFQLCVCGRAEASDSIALHLDTWGHKHQYLVKYWKQIRLIMTAQ